MPSASETTAVSVNPGFLSSCGRMKRKSCSKFCMDVSLRRMDGTLARPSPTSNVDKALNFQWKQFVPEGLLCPVSPHRVHERTHSTFLVTSFSTAPSPPPASSSTADAPTATAQDTSGHNPQSP